MSDSTMMMGEVSTVIFYSVGTFNCSSGMRDLLQFNMLDSVLVQVGSSIVLKVMALASTLRSYRYFVVVK